MAAIPTNDPKGTGAQNQLLYQGTRAVVSASALAFASLANGQTFVTITPAGAADSRTINAALAASTDLPTFCAALALELNTANTTAYNWTATASTVVGTAKAPGRKYNSLPTGTCLDTAGSRVYSAFGEDPISGSQKRIIEIFEPAVAAASKNFYITNANWRYLEFTLFDCGDTQVTPDIRVDGVSSGYQQGYYFGGGAIQPLNRLSSFLAAIVPAWVAGNTSSYTKLCMTKTLQGKWAVEVSSSAKSSASVVFSLHGSGEVPAISSYLQVFSTDLFFRVGSKAILEGIPT